MGKIKGLSFDMYRTLINTKDFHEQAVLEILKKNNAESVDPSIFHRRWDEIYDDIYLSLNSDEFKPLYDISIESLKLVMQEFGVKGDPKADVDIWVSKYENADLYPDVNEVFEILSKKYLIVITSNVDNNDPGYSMLRKKNLPIKAFITSETSRSYKPDEKIFRDALSVLGLQPDEVLHTGDSQRADILGGKKIGMVTAWVKRKPSEDLMEGIPEPNYIISSIRELLDLDCLK